MRPRKPQGTSEGDLSRARLDQIINMRHELVQLASEIDWDWIDQEIAPLYTGGQFVLHAKALPDNPYDGHTLAVVIDATEQLTGCAIECA